jgi:methionyl-tRNA formyltransferase
VPLRVVFAGTPPFAARSLEALVAAGHDVALVLTQPDRPAGRGMRMASSAVAQAAQRHGIALLKPASLKQGDAVPQLQAAAPDVMVVAAYGLLLPPAVLGIPGRGCINIHASLLPRWRGAAPIQRALLAGDSVTGVSIMQMDEGLDTGAILLQQRYPIPARETTGSLTGALAALGAEAIVTALARLDTLPPRAQPNAEATLAPKIAKAEARIDWSQSNEAIDRVVRAFNPAPGAETTFLGESLKIWEAEAVAGEGKPGAVIQCSPARLVIACGQGALSVQNVQRPGGKKLAIAEFLRGVRVGEGARMESASSTA